MVDLSKLPDGSPHRVQVQMSPGMMPRRLMPCKATGINAHAGAHSLLRPQ
jgi:hypothetical protein